MWWFPAGRFGDDLYKKKLLAFLVKSGYMGVEPKIGGKKNQHGWFIMENLIKMGWFGGPTPIFRNTQKLLPNRGRQYKPTTTKKFQTHISSVLWKYATKLRALTFNFYWSEVMAAIATLVDQDSLKLAACAQTDLLAFVQTTRFNCSWHICSCF